MRLSFLNGGADARRLPVKAPLFRVVFNFVEAPGRPLQLWGLQTTRLNVLSNTPSFADLSLQMRDGHGPLECVLLYKADVFSPAQIETLARQYQELLSLAVAQPDRDISTFGFERL